MDLVAAVAVSADSSRCVLEHEPLLAWLSTLAAESGFPTTPISTGTVLDVPDVGQTRRVVAWLGPADDRGSLEGARRRLLEPGLVADEVLDPRPTISVPIGELRLWVELAEDPRWTERESFVLGGVARRLARSATQNPFGGEGPVACSMRSSGERLAPAG